MRRSCKRRTEQFAKSSRLNYILGCVLGSFLSLLLVSLTDAYTHDFLRYFLFAMTLTSLRDFRQISFHYLGRVINKTIKNNRCIKKSNTTRKVTFVKLNVNKHVALYANRSSARFQSLLREIPSNITRNAIVHVSQQYETTAVEHSYRPPSVRSGNLYQLRSPYVSNTRPGRLVTRH